VSIVALYQIGTMLHILCVDDNECVLELQATLCREGLGARVGAARSGAEALAYVGREGPPGLVLTDMMMPGMSGTELIARLRALPGCAAVPVVLVSAIEDGDEVRSAGAAATVRKPFRLLDLVEVLRRLGTSVCPRETDVPARVVAAFGRQLEDEARGLRELGPALEGGAATALEDLRARLHQLEGGASSLQRWHVAASTHALRVMAKTASPTALAEAVVRLAALLAEEAARIGRGE